MGDYLQISFYLFMFNIVFEFLDNPAEVEVYNEIYRDIREQLALLNQYNFNNNNNGNVPVANEDNNDNPLTTAPSNSFPPWPTWLIGPDPRVVASPSSSRILNGLRRGVINGIIST